MIKQIILVPCNKHYYQSEYKYAFQNGIFVDIHNDNPNNIRRALIGYRDFNIFAFDKDEIRLATKEEIDAFKKFCMSDNYKTKEIIKLKTTKLANKTFKIINGYLTGNEIVIEDWAENVLGNWRLAVYNGNPSAYNYFMNHQRDFDNRNDITTNHVLYGKIGAFGYLVNINELCLPENYNVEQDYVKEIICGII